MISKLLDLAALVFLHVFPPDNDTIRPRQRAAIHYYGAPPAQPRRRSHRRTVA